MKRTYLKETQLHGTPNFPLAIYNNHFDKEYSILAPLHYHNEFELLLVTKGSISVQIEESTYILFPGDGVFINSGLLHTITAREEEEHGFIAIVFNHTLISGQHDIAFHKYIHPLLNDTLKVPVHLSEEICNLIPAICKTYESDAFGFELFIKYNIIKIFHLLIKNAQIITLPMQNTKSILIKTLLDYIEENYAEQISLQDMADYIHISKEYLCRIFRTMADTSPFEYLNHYRIQESASLLIHTTKSISDISISCGFNSSSYFNKLFFRYMGCTPTEYRKKNITQKPN